MRTNCTADRPSGFGRSGERVANSPRHLERVAEGAYDNTHSASHILKRVNVHRRLYRLAQSTLPHVAHHANDFNLRRTDAENLSHRALVRPMAPRQLLVHDQHHGGAGAIGWPKLAASL
jgi:hypothetical protein